MTLCQNNPIGLIDDLMVPVDVLFKLGELMVRGRYLPKIRILQTDKMAITITTREKYFLMQCYLTNSLEFH